MRKAPPPTLPDAIRLLPPKREVHAEPASILNISGGIPTLNQRSKTFEKVMKDIPCISYHDDDVKSRQPLMSPKTYINSSVVFIPYSNNNEIAEST
ncbi:hypothetical protein Ocin01_13004 [Orchesella cincta]|uniref:Uncharacterized protein n=1 Tax=Orchesella cincta TaxID=48709 RepID=A0A1D2ML45_ORCCI|nr:hypothetical protein Ocin01_13004 [Orchesella cincta]